MKKRVVAVLLSAVMGLSLLTACGSKESTGNSEVSSASSVESVEASESSSLSVEAEEDYNGKLVSEGEMALDYAEGFSIEEFKGGYRLITIKDSGARFLTVPEDMQVPEELDADVTVLQLPLNNVYIASTGLVSLVDAIGALDHVKLVATDVDSWYLDDVVTAMNNGEIGFSGNYKEPDYEMMAANDIQLHIDTTMIDNCPEVLEKFDELGIPNLIEMSSKEGHPLARVEWVKVLGVLFDKEAEADSYFEGEKELMAQSTAAEDTGITVAMGYITSSGKCYARNGGDYLVQMIQMAGGDYICADMEPEKSGNTSMTFEEWYAKFKDADYLFYWNLGQKFYSIEEMTEYEPLFADFKAVQEGHVWITSPDFSQATSAIASIVADMNTILSSETPDEVTTDHLIKLPEKAE